MPAITKNLQNGKSLYHYSNDIVWGCRHFARLAKEEEEQYSVYIYNNSCVFLAGSFMEAKINELTAQVVDSEPESTNIPFELWNTIHSERKTLSFKTKWNLISSASGGQIWDAGKDPFQSYELVISLRNELVHYKPEYEEINEPPVKKINDLLTRFKTDGFVSIVDPDKEYWVTQLLCSRELSSWISSIIDEFDMKFDFFLVGKEISDIEKTIYKMRQASGNPWTTELNLTKPSN